MRRRVGKLHFYFLLFSFSSNPLPPFPIPHLHPSSFSLLITLYSPFSLSIYFSLWFTLSLSPYSTGWVFFILHFKLSIGLRFLSHGLCLSIVFHALVLAHSPSCVEQRRSAHAGLYSQHTPMCLVNRWKRIPSECRPISELPCRASGMSELQK